MEASGSSTIDVVLHRWRIDAVPLVRTTTGTKLAYLWLNDCFVGDEGMLAHASKRRRSWTGGKHQKKKRRCCVNMLWMASKFRDWLTQNRSFLLQPWSVVRALWLPEKTVPEALRGIIIVHMTIVDRSLLPSIEKEKSSVSTGGFLRFTGETKSKEGTAHNRVNITSEHQCPNFR